MSGPAIIMPVRGLRAPDAARYIGMSESKFLEMVADGRLPCGFTIDRMRVWDIRDLDAAFDVLKHPNGRSNHIDEGWGGVTP